MRRRKFRRWHQWPGMPGECNPGNAADAPAGLREERLGEEEDDRAILPLKNGAGRMRSIDVRLAQEELRFLLKDDPELFKAFHALAEGRGKEVSQKQRLALRQWQSEVREGGLRPAELKAVILAGYFDTPAGPGISEPFDLSNPEHEAIAERIRQRDEAVLNRPRRDIRLLIAELKAKEKSKGDKDEKGGSLSP
jgi:hypothetical protein